MNCDNNVSPVAIANGEVTFIYKENMNCGVMGTNVHEMVPVASSYSDKDLTLMASALSQKENLMPVQYDDGVFVSKKRKGVGENRVNIVLGWG